MSQVVYTDLDGTLIDFKDYSFHDSLDAVKALNHKGIPVVFCSSKTRVEQEVYLDAFGLQTPFIVENGSAIFIPKGYFSFDYDYQASDGNYDIIELGTRYSIIRSIIEHARSFHAFEASGYGDLSLTKIMEITGLSESFAKNAASREYSETILLKENDDEAFMAFKVSLADKNLTCVSGGKYHTVMSQNSDKGKAVELLSNLFRKQMGQELVTYGLGDSSNDYPLLKAVDYAFLVQKPPGVWTDFDEISGLTKVDKIGPLGWCAFKDWLFQN